jgi:hypothetical protein
MVVGTAMQTSGSASFMRVGGPVAIEPMLQPTPAMADAPPVLGFESGNLNMYASTESPLKDLAAQQSAPGLAPGPAAQPDPWDRKIIRTATMQLTVKDVNPSVNFVLSLASKYQGRVVQMDTRQQGEYNVSSITIQVPSAQFDKIMPELRELGGQVEEIVAESVSSSDVTEEFTDLESQLRNLRATEGRMLALQQKAERLEDILALDRELRQIQSEIERIQGRVNFLGKSAEMSTISLTLSPEPVIAQPVVPEPEPNAWDPGRIALQAWYNSLDLLTRVATVIIAVAVFLWWTIPFIVIGVWLARRAKKQASQPSAPAGESNV